MKQKMKMITVVYFIANPDENVSHSAWISDKRPIELKTFEIRS